MLQPPLEKLVTEWLATRPRRPPTLKGSKQERIRAAQAAARDIVQAHFDVVFRGAQLEDRTIPPVGDPYIASFCGHSKDQAYERENGLLSQWRGYGGHGGYCIVFDTEGVDRLLDNEFKSHYYSHGFFGPVIYADDPTEVSKLCKPLLAQFQKVVSAIEAGENRKT